MADESQITTKKLWMAILVAVLGGNFTGILNSVSPTIRADPVTGTESRAADAVLQAQIHAIDKIQNNMVLRMQQREEADRQLIEWVRTHDRSHP